MHFLLLLILPLLLSGELIAKPTEKCAEKKHIFNDKNDDLAKKTRGYLKETLGEELKKVVGSSIVILNSIGDMQVEMGQQGSIQGTMISDIGQTCKSIASIQKMVSDLLERLIDNSAPLKRATKISLKEGISLARRACHRLQSQVRALKGVAHMRKKSQHKKDDFLSNESRMMLAQQQKEVALVYKEFKCNELIKKL